jgi:hypothetical protein
MVIYYQHSNRMGQATRDYIIREGAGTLEPHGTVRSGSGRIACREQSFDLTPEEFAAWERNRERLTANAFAGFGR